MPVRIVFPITGDHEIDVGPIYIELDIKSVKGSIITAKGGQVLGVEEYLDEEGLPRFFASKRLIWTELMNEEVQSSTLVDLIKQAEEEVYAPDFDGQTPMNRECTIPAGIFLDELQDAGVALPSGLESNDGVIEAVIPF